MQPYKSASETLKKQSDESKGLVKGALSIAGSLGTASAMTKLAPFLSEYLPMDLAIKGISKVSPKVGSFIKEAQKNGFDFNDIKNFLGEGIKETTKQDKNIIQQYSPELDQFMNEEIQKGRSPIEAGAVAQNDKRFKPIIDKLTKDHNAQWSQILESTYQNPKQKALGKFNEHQGKKSMLQEETERFEKGYGQKENINDAFKQMGGAITGNFYKGIFESLQKGKDTFAGVKDSLIPKLKPLYDKGLIKSPEDVQKYANQNSSINQQQSGQGQQALMAALQKIMQM